MSSPLGAGTKLGRYEIRSQLGAGGMGEVYLAHDTELERIVALKLLPSNVASDQQRMHRFVQEAKAASALNHPNILTIHEIGRADGLRFITMEYIDGLTLRKHTAVTRMKPAEVLDVGLQVASALAAAHQAGILHRDIKPENIMIRHDGIVKVLDFGLAKLTERQTGSTDTEAPTRALVNTGAGTVMGTAAYMSPEQARGQPVDARTDIWSLGVVLYEMVTGRMPFEGATASDVIASILDREPAPMARYSREVPEELEWIVSNALTKDREGRYQTAKEMVMALRRLKQRLELDAEIERSVAPDFRSNTGGRSSGGQSAAKTASGFALSPRTGEIDATHTVSSAEYLVKEIKSHKRGLILTLGVLIVAVVGGLALYKYLNQRFLSNQSAVPFHAMKLSRLTNTGKTTSAAISPDGKYVVHVVDDGASKSLWLRQVATNSNVQIIQPADLRYIGLTFSRDGNFIYYVIYEKDSPVGIVYQMSILGGAPRKVIEDVDTPVTFSPDGKRFAFVRNYPGKAETGLFVANVDGSGEQRLATRTGTSWFDRENSSMGPTWSPNGETIACSAGGFESGVEYHTVVDVRVVDGAEKPITTRRWPSGGQVAWLSNGSGLVFIASEHAGGGSQIWYISYPGGETQKITNDLNNYIGVSLTGDSTALVTAQSDVGANIWVSSSEEKGDGSQITSGKENGTLGLAWSPEGRIIYTSKTGGNFELWIMDANRENQKELTVDASDNGFPTVSPDGRYVLFTSTRSGAPHIWRINIDGSNLKQLTNGNGEDRATCSLDGKWVIYTDFATNSLWKVPMEGGNPSSLTDKLTARPAISPDGKLIACRYREAPLLPFKIGILSLETGQPIKLLDLPSGFSVSPLPGGNPVRWMPGGRSVAYVDTRDGVSNIWARSLDGGPPKQITNFKSGQIFFFDWSRDGKQLALSRGFVNSDVVLISEPR